MARIFMVRIEDDDFDLLREKCGKESLQGTDDEQVVRDFMRTYGVTGALVWQVQ